MGWWLATVLFGSILVPLAVRVNWSGRLQPRAIKGATLVLPVLGLSYFAVAMLFTPRSPFAGPVEVGVTTVAIIAVLGVTGLSILGGDQAAALFALMASLVGVTPCIGLLVLGAPVHDPPLTPLGVGGLCCITVGSSLRLAGRLDGELSDRFIPHLGRWTRLSLALMLLLLTGALALQAPSAVASTLCGGSTGSDVTDVRIAYEETTMIGRSGVYVHGRQVYFLDQSADGGSPAYRAGTVSTDTVQRLLAVIDRNGILCLNERYRGLIWGSESISNELSVSTETASGTIEASPRTAAPPQVRRAADALWEIGREQPRVTASRFCERLPADVETRLGESCEYRGTTDALVASVRPLPTGETVPYSRSGAASRAVARGRR